jgi:N-hydroxyarylamine O-acetyltransferase
METLDRSDLRAYLDRIRFVGTLDPTLTTLGELQQAHCAAIPFENIDVVLRREIKLDLASVRDKLISAPRGRLPL